MAPSVQRPKRSCLLKALSIVFFLAAIGCLSGGLLMRQGRCGVIDGNDDWDHDQDYEDCGSDDHDGEDDSRLAEGPPLGDPAAGAGGSRKGGCRHGDPAGGDRAGSGRGDPGRGPGARSDDKEHGHGREDETDKAMSVIAWVSIMLLLASAVFAVASVVTLVVSCRAPRPQPVKGPVCTGYDNMASAPNVYVTMEDLQFEVKQGLPPPAGPWAQPGPPPTYSEACVLPVAVGPAEP